MSIRLRDVTDDELPEFLVEADRFYVEDLVAHAGMTEERAREKSRRDHESLFPGGERRPGHHVCWIDEGGTRIGRVCSLGYGEQAVYMGKELSVP